MNLRETNLITWVKVLLASLALVVSSCGSSEPKDFTNKAEAQEGESSGEEGEKEDEEKEDEEKEVKEKEEDAPKLSFLDQVKAEEGTCFADVEVESVNVFVPFFDIEEGFVVDSGHDVKLTIDPTAVTLSLSDSFVVADLAKSDGKKEGLYSENVGEGTLASDVEYVTMVLHAELEGSFKYQDKIFSNSTLNNEASKASLLYYELIKSYFETEGQFKLSFNGKTFVATEDSSMFEVYFSDFTEVIKESSSDEEASEDVAEEVAGEDSDTKDESTQDVSVEDSNKAEAKAEAKEEASEESADESQKEASEDSGSEEPADESQKEETKVYYTTKVKVMYLLSAEDLASNFVQKKSAKACAEKEEESEEESSEEGDQEASEEQGEGASDEQGEGDEGDEGDDDTAPTDNTAPTGDTTPSEEGQSSGNGDKSSKSTDEGLTEQEASDASSTVEEVEVEEVEETQTDAADGVKDGGGDGTSSESTSSGSGGDKKEK